MRFFTVCSCLLACVHAECDLVVWVWSSWMWLLNVCSVQFLLYVVCTSTCALNGKTMWVCTHLQDASIAGLRGKGCGMHCSLQQWLASGKKASANVFLAMVESSHKTLHLHMTTNTQAIKEKKHTTQAAEDQMMELKTTLAPTTKVTHSHFTFSVDWVKPPLSWLLVKTKWQNKQKGCVSWKPYQAERGALQHWLTPEDSVGSAAKKFHSPPNGGHRHQMTNRQSHCLKKTKQEGRKEKEENEEEKKEEKTNRPWWCEEG